jgi:hypothetical protein
VTLCNVRLAIIMWSAHAAIGNLSHFVIATSWGVAMILPATAASQAVRRLGKEHAQIVALKRLVTAVAIEIRCKIVFIMPRTGVGLGWQVRPVQM